ncbi:hypothetical protein HA402_015771 [Bradysia odoriphaga]|nr:hypothetical protein HA402_015771 [Bradysia odoriphaga]
MNVLLNIVLIVCLAAKLSSGNILLIKDYLKTKLLSTLLLISCGNETYPLADVRSLNGFWINVWDVSRESMLTDFNYNQFFGRYSHPHGVVLNLDCDRTDSLLIQLSKRILFHKERFWLMYTSNLEKASSILSSQNIKVDAEIVLAVPDNFNYEDSYNIYEVFKLSSVHGRETHFNLSQLGDWNKSDGFNIPGKQSKTERIRNLRDIPNGKTYIQHLQSEDSYHLDNMNRMSYRLVHVLMDMYNFKIHLRLATIWGSLDSKKRWLGAIGLLNRSEVDFSTTCVRLGVECYGAFEFTTYSHRNQ